MLYVGLNYEDLEREGFLLGYSNLCLRAVFPDDKLVGLFQVEGTDDKYLVYQVDESEVVRKIYGLMLLVKRIGWEKDDVRCFYSPIVTGMKKVEEKEGLIEIWSEFNVIKEVKNEWNS